MSDSATDLDSKVTSVTFIDFVMRVRRRVRQVPLVFCLMILTSFFQAGQSVWSLSIPHQVYIVSTVSQFCRGMDLTPAQTEFCFRNRELMASIRDGASLAIKQCHYQFQYRRWNCSVPERDSNTLFRRITGKGTREAAFTYAIASAGVAHSIARACVGGNLSLCGCSRERRPEGLEKEYQWGGCGDNIEAGAKYAKEFLNAGEESVSKEKDTSKLERTLMNLHNNEVGIQVVTEEAKILCKCHGLSGSCNIKTCSRHIAEFRVIGEVLHQKYDNALRVKMEKAKTDDKNVLHVLKKRKNGGYRRDNGKLRSTKQQPKTSALVFLKDSPNFCVKSSRHEFPGTVGRICSTDSYGSDSCHGDNLCCGRGYRSERVQTIHRCKCKFHWCCEIRCKRCEKVETRNTCR
ncbi:protein Wnt-5a-like isoform X2 [Oculina patagonica]